MALTTTIESPNTLQVVHRLPQNQYIDALRWLPQLSSTFHRHLILATSDSSTSSLQTLSLSSSSSSTPTPLSSHPTPSRIISLKTSQTPHNNKPLIAASTFSGSLLVFTSDIVNDSVLNLESEMGGLHVGPGSGIDLSENGLECVSVGEDGRVNLVSFGGERVGDFKWVFDSNGLISYTAVKWASPVEFVTGGLGFGLHWWDQRRPGGPVSLFKGLRDQKMTSGIVHSIDIHPSRKHTCLAGGSSGTVFAWDLRWQQQPIILSGTGTSDARAHSLSESEVWEVQYDNYTHSSNIGSISSSRILPAMICSEDGILAVVEQGQEPVELLAEPCAINSFDIDRQNPSDIICSLEWESLALVSRP